MRYRYKLILALFGFNLLYCQSAISSNVETVVKSYCELDFKGARVFNKDYQDIVELMNWEEDQDEPGWDCFYIISGYQLNKQNVLSKSAKVEISYDVIAELCSDFVLDNNKFKKVANFELEKVNNKWKIKEYVTQPMVSLNYAIKYFEEQIKEEQANKDNDKVAIYKKLILDLKKLTKP